MLKLFSKTQTFTRNGVLFVRKMKKFNDWSDSTCDEKKQSHEIIGKNSRDKSNKSPDKSGESHAA